MGENGWQSQRRIYSIDSFKSIAMFGVILHHTNFGVMCSALGGNWGAIYIAWKQTSTIYVPFFAIASGYFFGKKVYRGANLNAVFELYGRKMVKVFLFWSLVYLIFPCLDGFSLRNWVVLVHSRILSMIGNPVIALITGGSGPLWFLFSISMSAYIVKLFGGRKHETGLLIFTFALYLFSLLVRTYSFLPVKLGIEIDLLKPAGIVCSLPVLFSIGWFLSSRKPPSFPLIAILAAVTGYCFYFMEHYLLRANINPLGNHNLLSTVLMATGCFMVLLSWRNIGRSTIMPSIGKYTLGIYTSHMLFLDLLSPLRARLYNIPTEIACACVAYGAALFLVMTCAKNRYLKDYFV
ncbi:MAG: acyltransferase [Syntrophobacterales bacterium]|nr:acyltransferase [Syntrophobacterales bacterium]